MITKEIAKYTRPPAYVYTPPSYGRPQHIPLPYDRPVTPDDRPKTPDTRPVAANGTVYSGAIRGPNQMSKLEFDMYVGKLPFKIGDLLVSKFTPKPYRANSVHKLTYIDEIHKFVENWGTPEIGPMILHLQPVNAKSMPFKGGASMFDVVAEADIPKEWKEEVK